MDNIRKVYVYSDTRKYTTKEYADYFKNRNAEIFKGSVESLQNFRLREKSIQLDTETNVTDFYNDRELYVVQIGDLSGTEQHIFDIADLNDSEIISELRLILESEVHKLAHNGKFEYIVLYKHFGIYTDNYKDTMLASKLITAGLDLQAGYNGLANLVLLFFGIDLSKASQTTFTGEMMTPEQLAYATSDVLYLGKLLNALMPALKKWDLVKCWNLENKSIRPIGDMTINGVNIDKKALNENIITYEKRANDAKQAMIDAFTEDDAPGVQEAISNLNIVQANDEVVINWNSSVQKRKILQYFYPNEDITSTSKTVLTKLEKKLDNPKFLTMYLNGNFDGLNDILISRHMDFLDKEGMLTRAGNLNINFNSNQQALEFFKIWYPDLKSVGVKVLKKLKHPVIVAYKKYAKANKLVTSFGSNMLGFIESDGKIHSSYNALTDSGSRMSSQRPNSQQFPSNEEFRRIFIPSDGCKLLDSDYASMELFLAADLSKDKNMLAAIEKGYDLHSYSAHQIFGDKWIQAGGDAIPLGKPKTAEAGKMRTKSKGASFSLLYGTGVTAFSENNDMDIKEGKVVIDAYYKAFPQLAAFFKQSGEDALRQRYVREPYFKRVRFFNKPTNGMEASHIKNAGMNYKPQATNMSIIKYALCLIKKYIEKHELDNYVKLVFTIHDEILTDVAESHVEMWAKTQTELMEKAAMYALPNGSIKADTDVLDHWTKG
jgi:DNA polymerase I-like protein with 3'-5' exonuclease and polymerase domains